MKCPNCNVILIMTDRNGIEIDYCPDCRGVWLDRGELDKIIERSSQNVKNNETNTYSERQTNSDKQRHTTDKEYQYKKKKGLLEDLFDF